MASPSLADRVERRTEALARRMVKTFVAEIPVYSRLPREQLSGEILAICRANLQLFFRCLRERRAPDDLELAEPRASAARRAEERVPLDAVLAAYHLGGRIFWDAICEEASPEDIDELRAYGDTVLLYLSTLSSAVATVYVEEQQHISGEERDARRRLAEALLAGGRGVRAQAERARLRLADGYLVLAVRVGPSSDEKDAGVAAAVAGRRKVRRVQDELDRLAGEPVLTLLDPAGGAVLFPLDTPDAVDNSELVSRLALAAEAEVLAGAAARATAESIPAAWTEASEVRRLAEALGRPPGAYRLDDVLLEHTLTHPPEHSARLTRVLAPLTSKPELLQTLEEWFAADFDRRQAANALSVHPNTLDYRLRRIAELTGLDVTSAAGLQLLGAALIARRLAT